MWLRSICISILAITITITAPAQTVLMGGTNSNGTAPTKGPLLFGGWDGTNIRILKTDSTGILQMSLPQQPFLNTTDFTDVTASSPTRGDIITAQGATPKYTRLGIGGANTVLHGGTEPSYAVVAGADCTNCVYNNQSNTYSSSTSQIMDTERAKYWGQAPVFDVSEYAGADLCAKAVNAEADSKYTSANRAILDFTGLQGDQNCASNMLIGINTHPTLLRFGETHVHVTTDQYISALPTATTIPAPSAAGLAASATGGSLLTATGYGIKLTYVNLNGESQPASEATVTTPTCGGNVCSITVTTPANSFAAVAYNIYSATPVGSGWKLTNTSGPIPLGVNYVIKTVGTGAVPPATSTATEDMYEMSGLGESTIFSMESATAGIAIINGTNFRIHDLKLTSSQTSNDRPALLWIANAFNVTADNLTLSGGGHQIFISNNSTKVNLRNLHMGNLTIANTSLVYTATGSTDIHISNIVVEPSVWPAGNTFEGVLTLNGCTRCSVDGFYARNLDFSTTTGAAGINIQGGTGINVSRVNIDSFINADGVLVAGLASDVLLDHILVKNSNATSGVGAFANNGDCIDIFTASQVTVSNYMCDATTKSSQPSAQRLPGIEIYESAEVSLGEGQIINGGYYGISSFGSPGLRISNINISRNADAGIYFQDYSSTVSCNGTTTVTQTSGQPFGPWLPNTPVIIAGTTYALASTPVSTGSLTLTTNCTTGSGLAMSVYTQDIQIANSNMDDNGKSPIGGTHATGHCEGIYLSGHTQATITGGSAQDSNATIGSKTQCYAVRMENNARSVITMMGTGGPTGNWGTGTGGDFQDSVGTSVIQKEDNSGGKTYFTKSQTADASVNIPAGVAPTTPVFGDIWTVSPDILWYDGTANQKVAAYTRAQTWTADQTFNTTNTGLKVPVLAGAVPTVDGNVANNSTNHTFVWGSNGTTMVGAIAATGTGTATTCTNQAVTAVSSLAIPTCTTLTSSFLPNTVVYNNAANTGTSAMTMDLSATSGATGLKTPVAAGAAPTANGAIALDSTALQYVGGIGGTKFPFASQGVVKGGVLNLMVTGSNFVTAANTNLQTITGLSFTFPASQALNANIDCDLTYSQQTAAVADAFGFQDATIAPTNLEASGFVQTAATTWVDSTLTASSTTTATNIVAMTPSAITTIWHAKLHIGIEQPSNASTSLFSVMAKTGTAADTLTVFRGSGCLVHFQ